MPGEFEPNDSRNVTGTAATPDGRWTGQQDKTPDAAGNPAGASAQQQQQAGMSGQQGGGQQGSSQQNQYDGSSGQMGGGGSDRSDLIGRVREHMAVLGPDGDTVGRVDSVEGGLIKLTRHDSPDDRHHYLDPGSIQGIEGDQIRLSQTPDWSKGESSRAM